MQKVTKKHARTCKKLPVASFCASETAETGRIANGREQDDHVSRRRGGEKARGAAKDLIGLVQSFCLCVLIRGSQNLESSFGKVLILLVRSRHCGELNQGLQNLRTPCKGNGFWYFLRRAKSTAKTRRGLRPSGLPGTIQSSAGEDFSKVFRRHEPNPAFRTKRWRKGFESVRGSSVTA